MNVGYPLAPEVWQNEVEHRRKLAQASNLALGGKMNAVTQVTLAANSTTTALIDKRIGANTFIGFSPLTANAAAAQAGLYVSSQVNGSATLTHANTATTDRTFNVLLIG